MKRDSIIVDFESNGQHAIITLYSKFTAIVGLYSNEGKSEFLSSIDTELGLGDNCLPLLIQMAASRDIPIIFEHFADFTDDDLAKGLIRVNGTVVNNFDDYGDTFSDWCETTEGDDYETRLRNCGL